MANELTFYDKIENPLEAIEKLGKYFVESGLFGCNQLAQGAVLAMACICDKRNPLDVARQNHIIDSTLSKKYQVMLAEFFDEGGKVEWIQRDSDAVEARFIHPRNGEIQIRITMEEVKERKIAIAKNGQLKDNYLKHPRNMLTARVVSEAMSVVAPKIVYGVYTPEEISDFDNKAKAIPDKTIFDEPKPKTGNKSTSKPKVETEPEIKEAEAVIVNEEDDTEGNTTQAETQAVKEKPFEFTDKQKMDLMVNADLVNKFLQRLGWITIKETFEDLKGNHKADIIDRFDEFMSKAKGNA